MKNKKPSLEDKFLALQIEKAHQALTMSPLSPSVSETHKESLTTLEPKERNVRVTVDMPESLHELLKYRIIKEKKSIRDYILKLLDKELRENE